LEENQGVTSPAIPRAIHDADGEGAAIEAYLNDQIGTRLFTNVQWATSSQQKNVILLESLLMNLGNRKSRS